MSGIFGCLRKDGAEVGPDALSRMMDAMAHWKADRSATWRAGAVGLGCRLLAVTPEAHGERLPAAHPRVPGAVITADARLDNRDELRERLHLSSPELASTPDSSLILLAYARWGDSCVDHLLGAFAFVIWDARRRSIFYARDPLGERPALFFESPALFAFASDVRAILALEDVPQRLNEDAMMAHLLNCPGHLKRHSFFQSIHKLPPGHAMTVTPESTRQRRYWRPEPRPELRLPTDEAYAEALVDQLQAATVRCLRSAHPIASHLSGGLDSSFLTVLAARRLREGGRALAAAYSWSPPHVPEETPPHDERALVEEVARQQHLSIHYTTLTPAHVADYLARDFTLSPTSSLLAELRVQEHAARGGIRILLSGWGGDEGAAFNGRGYFSELLARGHWGTLWREHRSRAGREGGALWSDLARRAILPHLPDSAWNVLGRDPASRIRRGLRRHGLTPDALGPYACRMLWEEWRAGRERPGVRTMQHRLLDLGHLAYRLEAWATEGATRGIEYRYPLLDRRLLDHCLALPSHRFFQGGWKRFGFRDAMRGLVPDAIRWNPSKRESSIERRDARIWPAGVALFLHRLAGGRDADPIARHTAHHARIRTLLSA